MSYTILGLIAHNRIALLFVLAAALVRGLFVPEHRHGLASLVAVQVVFPLLLCIVFVLHVFDGDMDVKLIAGLVAIALANAVAHVVLWRRGPVQSDEFGTVAMSISSAVMQAIMFLIMVGIVIESQSVWG